MHVFCGAAIGDVSLSDCTAGVLCGSCANGTSVTAIYSHCEVCHAAVGVVFIVIGERAAHTRTHAHTTPPHTQCLQVPRTPPPPPVAAAAAAMVLILVFNVKLPPWMFGLLFYIRVRDTLTDLCKHMHAYACMHTHTHTHTL